MRTTLNLDDETLALLRRYARSRSLSLSNAVAELVRLALNSPVRTRIVNGLHVVDLPPGGEVVTAEKVRQLLEDGL